MFEIRVRSRNLSMEGSNEYDDYGVDFLQHPDRLEL